LWQGIFAGLVGCNDPPTVTMIDSTAVKAHRMLGQGERQGARAAADIEDPIAGTEAGKFEERLRKTATPPTH
jgi:hypothetical protein